MKTKEHGTLEVLENSAQYDGGLVDDGKSLMFWDYSGLDILIEVYELQLVVLGNCQSQKGG